MPMALRRILGEFFLLMYTRAKLTAMRTYRIVHTTGNSHPGGDKGGLFNFANTFIPFLVKNPETAPVARGTAMQVISFLVSFFKNIPLSGLGRFSDNTGFLCLLYFGIPFSIRSYIKKKQLCFYAELFLFVNRLNF